MASSPSQLASLAHLAQDLVKKTVSSASRAALIFQGVEPAVAPRFATAGLVQPFVDNSVNVDTSAVITGNVFVGTNAVLGRQVVLKSGTHRVEVRHQAVIGDGAVLTAISSDVYSKETGLPTVCIVGTKAVIGPRSVLESCIVEDGAVIGDGSVIGEGAIVGKGAHVDAGTVVPKAKYVPAGEHWGGNPIKYFGPVSNDH